MNGCHSQNDLHHDLTSQIRVSVRLSAQGRCLRRLRSPVSKTSCPIGARLSDKADTALCDMVGVTAEPLTLHRAGGRACDPEAPTRTCAGVCRLRQTIDRPTDFGVRFERAHVDSKNLFDCCPNANL